MSITGKPGKSQFRNRNGMLILTLALILICLAAPAGAVAQEAAFSDLPADNSSYPYINYLVNKNIISGYPDGTFRPVSGITRAETAAMLVKASGLTPANPPAATFTDIGPGHWAYGVVEAAAVAGMLKGYPDGSFRPDAQVTRAETAALILKLTSRPLPVVALPPSVQDVGENHWACDIIAAAVDAGLLEKAGTNSFDPDVPAQRSQVARGLALMMTMSPDRPDLALDGSLVAVEGEVLVKRDGEFESITGTTSCGEGTVIKTGPAGVAELNFPDGSGLRLEPDTEITIIELRGKAAIMPGGTPGAYVDYLEVRLDRGRMFGALAYGYIFKKEKDQETTAFTGSDIPGSRLLASAGPLPLGITLAENEAPWWETASDSQVRVKVDMPWGVAGVRGTFWSNLVTSTYSTTSVLQGMVQLTGAGGQTVNVPGGYSSQMSGTVTPPARMGIQEMGFWNQIGGWVQQRAQSMQNGILSAPPNIVQQMQNSIQGLNSGQSPNPPDNGRGGGGTAPRVVSTDPYDGQTGVAPDSIISITFADDIQAGNADITIVDENGDPVDFEAQISGHTLKLTPNGPFKNSWPTSGQIEVVFNGEIEIGSAEALLISGGEGSIDAATVVDGNTLVALYHNLDSNTVYRVTIPSGKVVRNGVGNDVIYLDFTTASN